MNVLIVFGPRALPSAAPRRDTINVLDDTLDDLFGLCLLGLVSKGLDFL